MFEKSSMPNIYCLFSMFQLDEACLFLTNKTCVVSFDTISTQTPIFLKVINCTKYHYMQLEGLLEIPIKHINVICPQFSQVFNQCSEIDINIISQLSWTHYHHTQTYCIFASCTTKEGGCKSSVKQAMNYGQCLSYHKDLFHPKQDQAIGFLHHFHQQTIT